MDNYELIKSSAYFSDKTMNLPKPLITHNTISKQCFEEILTKPDDN